MQVALRCVWTIDFDNRSIARGSEPFQALKSSIFQVIDLADHLIFPAGC
jgi:hypothetical protein